MIDSKVAAPGGRVTDVGPGATRGLQALSSAEVLPPSMFREPLAARAEAHYFTG
jgi:hypothetical protein